MKECESRSVQALLSSWVPKLEADLSLASTEKTALAYARVKAKEEARMLCEQAEKTER